MRYARLTNVPSIALACLILAQRSSCYAKFKASANPVTNYLGLDTKSPYELIKIDLAEVPEKNENFGKLMPNGMRLKFRAFGKNVDLWLEPRDSVLASDKTPVYYSKYSSKNPGRVTIEEQFGLMKRVGKILENPDHLASLVIGTDAHGRRTINGRIASKKLVVRSLPRHVVVDEYSRKRRSIDDEIGQANFLNSTHHAVYLSDDDFTNSYGGVNETMLQSVVARSKRGIPYALYPKILLIADHSMFQGQGREIYSFLEYLLSFANGVDLKYRALKNPRVRLHIAGIIIGTEVKGTPYISDNLVSNDAFEGHATIRSAATFFHQIRKTIPKWRYDAALTLTRFAFGLGAAEHIMGQANFAKVCPSGPSTNEMAAIAIIRDNGAFSGIQVAAHELGHVLGLKHDYEQSDECKYTNGFIMSITAWYTTNSSSFSACSMNELQKLLDEQRFGCMYKRPRTRNDRMLPKLLPGRMKGLVEQCSSLGFVLPCHNTDPDICVNISCLDTEGNCLVTGVAALDGTRCGNETSVSGQRFCVHNRCVRV